MMNYVENFDILEKKVKQIPCITGQGAPSDTDGAVGLFYMDTNTDALYKCTATDGNRFIWNPVTTQPNWNQNDEAQSDYIINRTHYKQSVYEIFHDKHYHWGYEDMPTEVNVKTDIPLTVDSLIGARVYMPIIIDNQVYFSTPCYISPDDITIDAEWIYFPYGKVDVATGTNVVMNVVDLYKFNSYTSTGDYANLLSIKLEIFNGKKLDSVYLPPEVPLISPAELDELASLLENAE